MTNAVTKALEDLAGKTVTVLGKRAGKAVEDLYHDTGKRLKQDADAHVENDRKIATDLKNIGRRDDPTPVYHIDDDGEMTRLHHNPDADDPEHRYTHEKLTPEDKQRIGLKPDSHGGTRKAERKSLLKNDGEGVVKPRPRIPSSEVSFGGSDLARATQLARHADNSYGGVRKEKFMSNNYAAARVTNADGKGDFIIVGRSHRADGMGRQTAHSERMIGTPFLRQNDGARIRQMYSEREPCPVPPNCSSWLAERLPHVEVFRSVAYGVTTASRGAGNAAMEQYLNALKAAR